VGEHLIPMPQVEEEPLVGEGMDRVRHLVEERLPLGMLRLLHLILMPQIALEARLQLEPARLVGVVQPPVGPQPGAVRLLVGLLVAQVVARLVDGEGPHLLGPPVVLVAGEELLLHGPETPGVVLHLLGRWLVETRGVAQLLLGRRIRGAAQRLEGQPVLPVQAVEMRVAIGEAVVVMNGDHPLTVLQHHSRHPRQALVRSRLQLQAHRCLRQHLVPSLLRRRLHLAPPTEVHPPLVCLA